MRETSGTLQPALTLTPSFLHKDNVLEKQGPAWRGEAGWQWVAYHGEADICLFEGWPVIGAIPGHGHHLPLLTGGTVNNPWNIESGLV